MDENVLQCTVVLQVLVKEGAHTLLGNVHLGYDEVGYFETDT